MSKEAVRQLVEGRFNSFVFGDEFTGEGKFIDKSEFADMNYHLRLKFDVSRKSIPNKPKQPIPTSGRWLRLHDIEFVLHKVASIGSEPCTRRTGVIVIDAFERLDVGTKRIFELTDAIERHFGLWSEPNFWTDPANTVNFPNDGDKNIHYRSRVYVPFTYDES